MRLPFFVLSNIIIILTDVVKIEAAAPHYHESFDTEDVVHPMGPNPNPYQVEYANGQKSPLIRLKIRGMLTSSSHQIYEETLEGFTVKYVNGTYIYYDVNEKTGEYIDTGVVAVAGADKPNKSYGIKPSAADRRYRIREEQKKLNSNRNLRHHHQGHRRKKTIF